MREVAEGKYRVVYRAQVSGKYVLRVMVDGVHVPRSPFVVQVEPEGNSALLHPPMYSHSDTQSQKGGHMHQSVLRWEEGVGEGRLGGPPVLRS